MSFEAIFNRGIFKRIVDLVLNPKETWKVIEQEKSTLHEVRRGFFFPLMLCLLAVMTLHLALSAPEWESASSFFSYFLKGNTILLVATFVGFYFSYLLTLVLLKSDYVAGINPDSLATFKLLLYASSFLWCIKMLTTLVSILFFLQLASVYVAYILWEGIPVMLPKVKEEKMGLLTIVLTILLYGCPFLMEKIMVKLMY